MNEIEKWSKLPRAYACLKSTFVSGCLKKFLIDDRASLVTLIPYVYARIHKYILYTFNLYNICVYISNESGAALNSWKHHSIIYTIYTYTHVTHLFMCLLIIRSMFLNEMLLSLPFAMLVLCVLFKSTVARSHNLIFIHKNIKYVPVFLCLFKPHILNIRKMDCANHHDG